MLKASKLSMIKRNSIKIEQNIWTDLSPKKIYTASKQMQKCSTSLAVKDMKLKPNEIPLHLH